MDTIKRLNENLSKLDEARKSALGFLSELTDDKSFVETGAFTSGTIFEDGVEALGEGIITGYATVFGIPVYLFVQNFEAMRGSFSSAQATKIKNVMQHALAKIQRTLMQPEVKQAGKEQVKKKAKESIMDMLAKAKIDADRDNRERWEREGRIAPKKKHDMEL